jgi:hypothetical protein
VLWYLPDLIAYLDPQKRFFFQDDRKWARNNQEYVAWAFLPMHALVYYWLFTRATHLRLLVYVSTFRVSHLSSLNKGGRIY